MDRRITRTSFNKGKKWDEYIPQEKIIELKKHLRRIGYKKGHQLPEEQRKRMSARMMGNTIWKNPKFLNRRFKRGKVPQYYWIDVEDLLYSNPYEAERELFKRDYHEGKIKTDPRVALSVYHYQNRKEFHSINHHNITYLKHLKIVQEYREKRRKFRRKYKINKTSIHTQLFAREFPKMYQQYRISLICVNRYERLFKKLNSEVL